MKKLMTYYMVMWSTIALTQDPEFTQFYANPVYLNPALAGSNGCPRLNMNYRNQWTNISGAYVTNSISYDQFVNVLQGGVAVMVTNDMAGKNTINWTTINLAYSYHLQLSDRLTILFGAQATWNQKFLDWAKLTFSDQIDPKRGFVYQTGDLPSGNFIAENSTWTTKGFFDVSLGTVIYSEKLYFGFTGKHLNTPEQSMTLRTQGDSHLPIRYTAHIGANIPFQDNSKYVNETTFSPNIIFTYQDGFKQYNLGGYIKYNAFTTGIWWRTRFKRRSHDAFILSMGLDAGAFKLGYSYDITISELTNASGGSHELSLSFNFSCKEPQDKFRTVICPSF